MCELCQRTYCWFKEQEKPMSKKQGKAPYLNKKTKKAGMKEQLLFGNGKTIAETEKINKKYKKNKLNE